jgi:hypothetical protein
LVCCTKEKSGNPGREVVFLRKRGKIFLLTGSYFYKTEPPRRRRQSWLARRFLFKPKIQLREKFWRELNWTILWPHGIFYRHLGYVLIIWYMLYSFGTCCIHLVHVVFIWYMLYSFGTCIHLVHVVFIWYMLYSFGKCCIHLVQVVFIWYISFRFWYHVARKIWQPYGPDCF